VPQTSPQVLALSLEEALTQQPALVQSSLMQRVIRPADGKLQALHAAHMNGGVIVRVPRGVIVEQPIAIHWHYADAERAYCPHVLVIAEEGSHVAILDEYTSVSEGAAVSVAAVEVIAESGAHVTYATHHQLGSQVNHVSVQRLLAARDAHVQLVLLSTGGQCSRFQLESIAEGSGAHIELLGVRVGRGIQQCHVVSLQDHPAAHTTSDLLLKSALHDSAYGTYYGLIRIHPKAQKCAAYQADRNLLLGEHAKAETTPVLEIEADDVRCTHGASVGPVDQQQLFYMRSRGIPPEIAQTMLVYGFLDGVLDRVRHPVVREQFSRRLIASVGTLDLLERVEV